MVTTARRCVSWSSHAVCGALSSGESELSLSIATHEGFRGWRAVSARGQCRGTLGDLQGIVRKKTRVPQRTTEPASKKIVHDGARAHQAAPSHKCRRHAARCAAACPPYLGVSGFFFADGDIDRGCNTALGTCGRLGIIFGTTTRCRRCSKQRRSTPTAPSDGSQSPDRARQAREPSGERRLPARWGRRALVAGVFRVPPFQQFFFLLLLVWYG